MFKLTSKSKAVSGFAIAAAAGLSLTLLVPSAQTQTELSPGDGYQMRTGTGATEEEAVEAAKENACYYRPSPEDYDSTRHKIANKECTGDEENGFTCTVYFQCK